VATATLDDILAKAYEEEGLTRADIVAHKGCISTGNLGLDFILGGGIARGRICELYGLSQSGKTTTASQTAAVALANGERVLYVDFEQALDTVYLKTLGVDVDNPLFIPYPASSLEQGMHAASEMIRTGEIALAVFDSVAAMTPRKIVEENSESRTTAMERARLLGNELAKLNPICARTGCAAVFINHERDVIETGWVPPGTPKRTTTPGGSGLKYYSSQRVQFRIGKQFKGERVDPLSGATIKETHSQTVTALVTKNKLAKPLQFAELYLVLGEGFSDAHAAIKVLEAAGIVKKTGAFYTFPEDLYNASMATTPKGPRIQGLGSILDLALGMPEWGEALGNRARAVLNMSQTSLKATLVDDPDGPGTVPVEAPENADEVLVTTADVAPKLPAPAPQDSVLPARIGDPTDSVIAAPKVAPANGPSSATALRLT
jgi:recombination protein RecA